MKTKGDGTEKIYPRKMRLGAILLQAIFVKYNFYANFKLLVQFLTNNISVK